MLVFVEQLPVASGQIVEPKRRWDWNGPVAGLREPMACIRRGAHHLDCHRLHARPLHDEEVRQPEALDKRPR